MPRQTKARKRQHKVIGFKAYADTDADLLAWWHGIAPGSRSDALRDLMRFALGYQPIQAKAVDPIAQVQDELVWMRTALNDLPGYVERVIQHVAENSVRRPKVRSPADANTQDDIGDDAALRRAQRMKKARW